jgi:phage host-nuclease inhibitor protein Gam
MARTKKELEYLTESEVDELLKEQVTLEETAETIRNAAEVEINEIQAEMDTKIAPIKLRLIQIKGRIHNYITQHAIDFIKKRSRLLSFGTIGLQKIRSDKINVNDEDAAIEALRSLKLDHLIVTVTAIDLKGVAKLNLETFAKIDGLSRPPDKEKPWFEAKRLPLPTA